MTVIEHSGPICEVCGVLYVEEGDGQSCTEPGCVGVVSWAATADRLAAQLRGAVDPAEIVAWLRGRTGYGGGFTSADDVADAIERRFITERGQ